MTKASGTSLHLNVGPAVLPGFMSGVLVCCTLAWPTIDEIATFHRVAREMESDVVRKTLKSSPDMIADLRENWPQQDWDLLENLARSKRRTSFGTLQKRLRQRGAAARMGNGLAHQELFGIPAVLPPEMTGISIDQLSKLVRSETTLAHSEDVEKHVWRASLPVIHLAMAAELIQRVRCSEGGIEDFDLQDVEFFEAVVRLGEILEPIVAAHAKFNIWSAEQARVRWLR